MREPKTLKELGERGLIRQIMKKSGYRPGSFMKVGLGDDAAVLNKPPGQVLSIDGLTDGVHFKSEWDKRVRSLCKFGLGEGLGRKAMGSALSDLAAMGDVQNRWAMVFLGAPGSTSVNFLKDFQTGINKASREFETVVVGGDTVRSQMITIVVAVGGELKSKPMLRKGVKENDFLCQAGPVGEAQAGLAVLQKRNNDLPKAKWSHYAKQFFDHRPLFKEGKILSQVQGVHSLIDLSDSVHESIDLLMKSHHLQIDINVNSIPKLPYSKKILSGGEDYGLLFTASPKAIDILRKKMAFSILGQFKQGPHKIQYFRDGKLVPPPAFFKQF